MKFICFVQVEDRKKAIEDAERERREYILRKNQERDARLDTKRRNERSSISFAFGSSTPRLLDPVEVNLVAPSGTYWNNRRSTSITNVSYGGGATQLSRRSSDRELSDGAKKRATSAGGLDRPDGEIQKHFTLWFFFFVIYIYFFFAKIFQSFHGLFEFYTHTQREKKSHFNEVSSQNFHHHLFSPFFYHSCKKKTKYVSFHCIFEKHIKHSSN